jgi:branched-chain amino acid aminotransferase
LAGNYAPCFKPQKAALAKGYQQNLWCLEDKEGVMKVTECGQMNFMVVIEKKREGNVVEVELATPNLDGTILPGVTVRISRSCSLLSIRLLKQDTFSLP